MWSKKINLISLYKGEEDKIVTGIRAKRLQVFLRTQVRSEVVGQTERYGFKYMMKKRVTTLGKEALADTK